MIIRRPIAVWGSVARFPTILPMTFPFLYLRFLARKLAYIVSWSALNLDVLNPRGLITRINCMTACEYAFLLRVRLGRIASYAFRRRTNSFMLTVFGTLLGRVWILLRSVARLTLPGPWNKVAWCAGTRCSRIIWFLTFMSRFNAFLDSALNSFLVRW